MTVTRAVIAEIFVLAGEGLLLRITMYSCEYPNDRRRSCQHAEEAADRAVKKTFAILGVDVDIPHEVEKFRQDLRFGSMLRKAADKGWLIFWGTFFAAMAYALYEGIKLFITKGSD